MQRAERLAHTFHAEPGTLAALVQRHRDDASRSAEGLWREDPGTWSARDDVRKTIANRLGWLRSPALMTHSIDRLTSFAAQIRSEGIQQVVLLGMGGSSLAAEVLRSVFGSRESWPRLHVLDSTDPAAVRAASTTPAHTLYLLSSKSGTTIEPNALAAHFRRMLADAGVSNWAQHFVAITDADTALERHARENSFREIFINPSDIGGRFSAISYFGLVPAALMGQDIGAMVDWANAMLQAARSERDPLKNPAVGLGLLMGAAARAGRDKLTLQTPPAFASFGLWVEQLIAESTGKEGVGIVPVVGEPHTNGPIGPDRLLVRLRLGESSAETRRAQKEASRVSTATLDIEEPSAIGAEFVRWEIATAIAGALLGVNPFDEPNVQQAKTATKNLLDRGIGPAPPDLTLTSAARLRLPSANPNGVLTLLRPGDYLAILAYCDPASSIVSLLDEFRGEASQLTGAAATLGIGPRYLHSTGQLHKGGANNLVFILVSAEATQDLDIPGERFTFGTLELAQALGDFSSLQSADRRGVHVHLPAPDPGLLQPILDRMLTHARRSGQS